MRPGAAVLPYNPGEAVPVGYMPVRLTSVPSHRAPGAQQPRLADTQLSVSSELAAQHDSLLPAPCLSPVASGLAGSQGRSGSASFRSISLPFLSLLAEGDVPRQH